MTERPNKSFFERSWSELGRLKSRVNLLLVGAIAVTGLAGDAAPSSRSTTEALKGGLPAGQASELTPSTDQMNQVGSAGQSEVLFGLSVEDIQELLGGVYHTVDLLDTSGSDLLQPQVPRFEVTSKSQGLDSVGLTQPAEQVGARFNLTNSGEYGDQPNMQFYLEVLQGHDGATLLRLSTDVAMGDGFNPQVEEATVFFGQGTEPYSFVVQVPPGGFPHSYDQSYSGGTRQVQSPIHDLPAVYLRLGKEFAGQGGSGGDAGGGKNLRTIPYDLNDITRVHLRLSDLEESKVVVFEAVRVK